MPGLDLVALRSDFTAEEARVAVIREIEAAAPERLIVDTFPRGLVGELPAFFRSFQGRKIFVQRDLNPQYSAAFHLEDFIRDSYDLVVVPGDASVEPASYAQVTAPWVVRSWPEVPSRERALELLKLDGTRPCVIVCAAGNPDELQWYGAVAALLLESGRCHVRCIAPFCPDGCPPGCWVRYWPAMDLYAAADVVVGGAGYNTIYECLACGVPLIARPWPRKYDRQGLRANGVAGKGTVTVVDDPRQAVAAALAAALSALGATAEKQAFHNGAIDAVRLIEQVESARSCSGGRV
jgi:predicted glycosyltransferase